MRPNNSSLTYRPEIDGLRAIAVIPVVLFHAGFSWFSGGYVGVDVFFVISGYLITSIILAELQAGNFSLAKFYERRARRILPALFVVLLACLIPAWLWLAPTQLRNFSTATATVAVFGSNVIFWRLGGYFGTRAEENPLIHTWSLAVEEQYYVLFPLLLSCLWHLGLRRIIWIVAGLAVASFGVSEYLLQRDPVGAFYLTPSRAWQLLAGALLAFALLRTNSLTRLGRWAREGLSLVGIGLILGATFTFGRNTPFPGTYALLPSVGAGLIIAFSGPNTLVGKALSYRYVAGIGLISYSLYLWHQPLFAFARVTQPETPSAPTFIVLTAISLVLAFVTWKYVETPFRRRSAWTRKQVFAVGATSSCALIALGAAGYLNKGFPGRYGPTATQFLATAVPSPERSRCHTSGLDYKAPQDACRYFVSKVNWAVLGDSHGVELAYALAESLKPNGGVLHLTFSACPPALLFEAHTPGCTSWLREAIANLEAQNDVRNVVVAFRHSYYLYGDQIEFFPRVPDQRPKFLSSLSATNAREKYWESFDALVRRLSKAGKRVYVLFPVPELSRSVISNVHRLSMLGEHFVRKEGLRVDYYLARHEHVLKRLRVITGKHGAIPIEPQHLLCEETRCFAARDDVAMYFDDNHLSISGARLLARYIVNPDRDRSFLRTSDTP